jgi:hypothetical protein
MNPLETANPLAVTKRVVGLAGTAAGLAGTVTREAVHVPIDMTRSAARVAGAAAGLAGTVVRETAHALRAGPADQPVSGGASEPRVVPVEPHAPEEPPVDVVGETLAAEAAAPSAEELLPDAGMAHEPRAASRDEEHGDATLQRAEVEEIAEETRAALEGDVEPEEHLTEPLLDPADAKAVAAELATMSRASDTDKD